jgi:hypothetical protein
MEQTWVNQFRVLYKTLTLLVTSEKHTGSQPPWLVYNFVTHCNFKGRKRRAPLQLNPHSLCACANPPKPSIKLHIKYGSFLLDSTVHVRYKNNSVNAVQGNTRQFHENNNNNKQNIFHGRNNITCSTN